MLHASFKNSGHGHKILLSPPISPAASFLSQTIGLWMTGKGITVDGDFSGMPEASPPRDYSEESHLNWLAGLFGRCWQWLCILDSLCLAEFEFHYQHSL
jgi:hypothetical protein